MWTPHILTYLCTLATREASWLITTLHDILNLMFIINLATQRQQWSGTKLFIIFYLSWNLLSSMILCQLRNSTQMIRLYKQNIIVHGTGTWLHFSVLLPLHFSFNSKFNSWRRVICCLHSFSTLISKKNTVRNILTYGWMGLRASLNCDVKKNSDNFQK